MARPRVAGIPEEVRPCATHNGTTTHRQHRNGRLADGRPKLIWRCVLCHAAQALQSYHRARGA